MSRESVLLTALTDEPVSTSDLYTRMGYPTLMRIGLIGYPAFRAELAKLAEAGLVASGTDEDGATIWWLTPQGKDASPGDRN